MKLENLHTFKYGYNTARSQGQGIRKSLRFAWSHMSLKRGYRKEAEHLEYVTKSGVRRVLNGNERR